MRLIAARFCTATLGGALLLQVSASTAADPGWQKVLARKGGCVMYVPPDWSIDPVVIGSTESADHTISAVISLSNSASTLAEVKPVMQNMYKPTKTFEDSAHRLWYQYEFNQRTGWYVGVPAKGGICGAQISFKPGKDPAVANQIAASVAAAT
jgi:hypothetical protein